ncbi:MAG: stage II sporulation protein M, partial [Gemmatimonadaceae bacterium]
LPREVQERLATQLVERIADRFPVREGDAVAFLATVLREEGGRRRGRFAARGARNVRGAVRGVANVAGAGPSSFGTSAVVERLVARKEKRWDEFDSLAQRATRGGLGVFAASELPDFAGRYREVASDLARARTYGADPVVRSRLERLVAAGHNLLYRDRRRTWRGIGRFFAIECPAAIVEARRIVLTAFLAFTLPALGGYVALRERPELAERALPPVLLERAEAGAEAKAQGRGYAQVDARMRGLASSTIITNNLGVAFACFASGIFLGVGSLISLAFNGLAIGAASGHYRNLGLLGYLWSFVAGHGVLELFAIWCAGAAGFLLGLGLMRPGDFSRRDALVLNARLAMRLVGSAIVMLLVAGTIEGFLSTSDAPLPVKVSTSVASALVLIAWLANGARHLSDADTESTSLA